MNTLSGTSLGLIIFAKILAMFCVAAVGFVLRRRSVFNAEITSTLARLLTDLIFPALVVAKLIDLVTWSTIRESAAILALGGAILVIGGIAAEIYARIALPQASRQTGAFLVAMPNWIFMPLPIVTVLYGADGVHALLLINVAMQFLLWTGGVWMLGRGASDAHPLTQLKSNRGLQATAAAFLLGLVVPNVSSLPQNEAMFVVIKLGRAFVDGFDMLGSLTVPLTLLVVGAQLGGLTEEQTTDKKALSLVVIGRLLVVPAICAVIMTALRHFGIFGTTTVQNVSLIVIAMPIAVTCSAFIDRFGGDIALGARAIFVSTIGSIATVPLFVVIVQRIWS